MKSICQSSNTEQVGVLGHALEIYKEGKCVFEYVSLYKGLKRTQPYGEIELWSADV